MLKDKGWLIDQDKHVHGDMYITVLCPPLSPVYLNHLPQLLHLLSQFPKPPSQPIVKDVMLSTGDKMVCARGIPVHSAWRTYA